MPTADDFHKNLQEITRYKPQGQTDSYALLQWFMFNIFRLDEVQARDSLCDRSNDKGIDGLWVDEDTEEIFIFQAKHSADRKRMLGDRELRAFVGSAMWFSNANNAKQLLVSNANEDLKALVRRLEVVDRLEKKYTVKLVFVTTRTPDTNAKQYLDTLEDTTHRVDLWDVHRLVGQFLSMQRRTRVPGQHRFLYVANTIVDTIEQGIRLVVGYVRASDIARMNGISDRSLFALNVRLGLDRTRVNRELESAVQEKKRQHYFKIFHNGVTIICGKLTTSQNEIQIQDYSVVNGCQSAIAFFENRKHLGDRLLILARIIEVGKDDALAGEITYRTNNQNGINLRDLRSNDRIQLSLKEQFRKLFRGEVEYLIKEGERTEAKEQLTNERAGQLILALHRNQPYNAHQKYRIFGSDYEQVFKRDVTPQKIYLAYLLYQVVEETVRNVEDQLIGSYQLTKFILLGLLGSILSKENFGKQLLESSESYVPKHANAITQMAELLVAHMINDFNYYVREHKSTNPYFDYKSEFKSPERYRHLANEMVRNYEHNLVRHPEDSAERILAKHLGSRKMGGRQVALASK